jgi:photosystem II stability/assembly factor-like uncharacterized protein
MTQVRVLAGTHKGGFMLTSDGNRDKWEVSGPHFAGWDVYHMKGSPADPRRIWASQHTEWFGQIIQRSDDGGRTWRPAGNDFTYAEPAGEHLWYDGTPRPFEFKRIWHLEPSPTDPDAVYAGAEDAALYRSADGGDSWAELPGLRQHATAGSWQPGAGGMCLHTIIVQEPRIYVAISAAGTFRSDDAGVTWQPVNKGLHTDGIPDPGAETGHCVHHVEAAPGRPDTLFMQKHWDVMRSDDGGRSWREISGNLPTDFGFPIAVHPHEPETVYVVPITSDSLHYPPEGRLQVWRSRTGGGTWEPLTAGLPQQDCYVNVYRDAMAVDTLDDAGIYFGTTGGQVYASADAGDTWAPIARDLPAVFSVEVQVLP